ncbi:LexA family protein [Desulfovulcanus sp.]
MKVLKSEIKGFEQRTSLKLPLYLSQIPAGFPSPADDYIDKNLDLNEFLIKHPAATFFVRAYGDSMREAGIHSGDILIVDRALEPKNNSIVVAVVNGELTVKRLCQKNNKLYLMPDNPGYQPLEITEDMDFEVWGVVTNVIHPLK